jgi:hypothetical protein
MSSHPAQKNALLKFVFANIKVEGEKLYPELKSLFQGILFANETNNWLPGTDSPLRGVNFDSVGAYRKTVST